MELLDISFRHPIRLIANALGVPPREMIERGPYADRPWLLHTQDAHELYRGFGFHEPGPRLMERPGPRRF